MARRGSGATEGREPRERSEIEGARLEPLRTVRRELVSPAGNRVVVEVPVYPPFRLKTDAERKAAAG